MSTTYSTRRPAGYRARRRRPTRLRLDPAMTLLAVVPVLGTVAGVAMTWSAW